MVAFASAVRERGGQLADDPIRDGQADRDGRYGYLLPAANGAMVRILMPGAELGRVRDDRSAAAPCLYVGDEPWWWPSAVDQAVGATNRPAAGSEPA